MSRVRVIPSIFNSLQDFQIYSIQKKRKVSTGMIITATIPVFEILLLTGLVDFASQLTLSEVVFGNWNGNPGRTTVTELNRIIDNQLANI